jgi:flagellar motor protein MotB
MVASSKYEMKTKEADALRDAIAGVNKEKTVLEARNEALQKQLADEQEANAAFSARVKAQEAELQRFNEELASARKSYEGTRITREQFISELLEKEKATGKRIQDLSARALTCEAALEHLRRDSPVGNAESADLKKDNGAPGDYEELKRERDILLGRVERLTEEHKQENRRRDDRFAALTEAIGKVSRDASVTPLGPALRVELPDKLLTAKGKSQLSPGGKKIAEEVGKAAAEFPTSSILLTMGGKKVAAEIRSVMAAAGKLPPARILYKPRGPEKGAELLLLVP